MFSLITFNVTKFYSVYDFQFEREELCERVSTNPGGNKAVDELRSFYKKDKIRGCALVGAGALDTISGIAAIILGSLIMAQVITILPGTAAIYGFSCGFLSGGSMYLITIAVGVCVVTKAKIFPDLGY